MPGTFGPDEHEQARQRQTPLVNASAEAVSDADGGMQLAVNGEEVESDGEEEHEADDGSRRGGDPPVGTENF